MAIRQSEGDSGAAMRLRELEFLISQDLIDEDYDFEAWPGIATPQDLPLSMLPPQSVLPSCNAIIEEAGDSAIGNDAAEKRSK